MGEDSRRGETRSRRESMDARGEEASWTPSRGSARQAAQPMVGALQDGPVGRRAQVRRVGDWSWTGEGDDLQRQQTLQAPHVGTLTTSTRQDLCLEQDLSRGQRLRRRSQAMQQLHQRRRVWAK